MHSLRDGSRTERRLHRAREGSQQRRAGRSLKRKVSSMLEGATVRQDWAKSGWNRHVEAPRVGPAVRR